MGQSTWGILKFLKSASQDHQFLSRRAFFYCLKENSLKTT